MTNEHGEKHRKLACHESFDSGNRIKAYLGLSGDQVCLEGLGEGANFGTFPRWWTADQLMESGPWLKVLKRPSEKEDVTRGVHYEPMEPPEWRPKTVILNRKGEDTLIAVRGDVIGGRNDEVESITVLSSATTAFTVLGEPAKRLVEKYKKASIRYRVTCICDTCTVSAIRKLPKKQRETHKDPQRPTCAK